jgi:hypothetical protein
MFAWRFQRLTHRAASYPNGPKARSRGRSHQRGELLRGYGELHRQDFIVTRDRLSRNTRRPAPVCLMAGRDR